MGVFVVLKSRFDVVVAAMRVDLVVVAVMKM